MLAALLNTPDNARQLDYFLAHNNAEHVNIVRVINTAQSAQLESRILYPASEVDFENWLYRHQLTHNDMNAVLGIAGNDLSEVDFSDQRAFATWVQLHFYEHQQAALKLRLG